MRLRQDRDSLIMRFCRICGDLVMIHVDHEDVTAWQNGEYIQDAMPYLTPGDRELLISGTCEACWERIFGGEEE